MAESFNPLSFLASVTAAYRQLMGTPDATALDAIDCLLQAAGQGMAEQGCNGGHLSAVHDAMGMALSAGWNRANPNVRRLAVERPAGHA